VRDIIYIYIYPVFGVNLSRQGRVCILRMDGQTDGYKPSRCRAGSLLVL